MIDPVVTAVERLSKKKIGALIAMERSTQMGAVTETGVGLDAVVSVELLETIFWPGTALHDMGVIVRQGRIVATPSRTQGSTRLIHSGRTPVGQRESSMAACNGRRDQKGKSRANRTRPRTGDGPHSPERS